MAATATSSRLALLRPSSPSPNLLPSPSSTLRLPRRQSLYPVPSLRIRSSSLPRISASTSPVMDQPPATPPTVVNVDIGNRSYPIYIGSGLLDQPDLLQRDPSALAYAIKRSCENKAELVSLDEKESGIRAMLNSGHTVIDT